jgi:hypothetical protein
VNGYKWQFEYSGAALAEAAQAKAKHHKERFDWWLKKKQEILDRIRAEGLEIEERMALQHSSARPHDWERGAHVLIRNDLQANLDECLSKLSFHTGQLNQYEGWVQVLAANPEARLALDYEDWLFFFGKHGSAGADPGEGRPHRGRDW